MAVTEGPASTPTTQQLRAADPGHSVWVTANAGTGKTRVLTSRVLRLLLAGNDPETILCLTFTRAASAEMAARIEARLASWATEKDGAKLAQDLESLLGAPAGQPTTDRARRLFAQVLDLPNGLAITTIHAFCQSLLRRFPLEAGTAPHFELIDERTARERQVEARQQVLASLDLDLQRAIEDVALLLADGSLAETLGQILALRDHLQGLADRHGGPAGVIEAVQARLEVDPRDTPATLVGRACRPEEADSRHLVPAANALTGGTAAQRRNGETILAWLNAAEADRRTTFPAYRAIFLTQKDEPRQNLVPTTLDEVSARALVAEQARLARVAERQKALEVARRTRAILTLGYAVIEAYADAKRQAAALDYDDLIQRTAALLADPGRREWVRFKLDARLDHLLVDEAQDTSPAQWSIIEHLVEEFHAGLGARRADRTLFVVGDEKQSIFSFQGADLASFEAVRERLSARFAAAGRPLDRSVLDLSFRSGPAIVELVEALLADPGIRAGVLADPGRTVRHRTFRQNALGSVELWPLERLVERSEQVDTGWVLPTERHDTDEPEARLALRIAKTVKGWLDAGIPMESTGRALRPGDILILLQRRGVAQERILKALKEEGIPVAGADRLELTEAIAVEDLVALGQALLLPEDDLNLAALLKSPLVGLGEDDLFRLAHDRGNARLVERLRHFGERGEAPFAAAWERFSGWFARADFIPPFELYARILGPEGGRRRLLQRLGPDAAEPIEAFLAQALAHEAGHPASLQGFLHWLGLESGQLKRDLEQRADAVRVMTVHGSKGLEAPIVLLADAGPYAPPAGRDRLIVDPDTGLPLWRAARDERDPISEAITRELERRAEAERWRLFYVAVTRAQDRLVVAGWDRRRNPDKASWHGVIEQALRAMPEVEVLDQGGLRLVRGVAAARPPEDEPPPAPLLPLPEWLDRPPPAEPRRRRLVHPSTEEALALPASSPLAGQGKAARVFGTALHRLLHEVAALPEERRADFLRARLAAWPGLEPAHRDELERQVLGVLVLAELAPAFGPGSRSEQPIIGRIGDMVIAGQIDRFAVTRDAVFLVDFKSGRMPPSSVDAVPAAYLRQLAAYGVLLDRLYPGRALKAGLVWTAVPLLMPIPSLLLATHAPEPA